MLYDSRMSFPLNHSISPSSNKPKMLMEYWMNSPQVFDLEVVQPNPVSKIDLYSVHNKDYVDSVLSGEKNTGFGIKSEGLAKSLTWTCGSILAASENALETGESSMSPTSGFHHAGHDSGGGFCTFNGLALVVVKLMEKGANVGIIDLDEHDGDGTRDILNELGLVNSVPHLSLGALEMETFGNYDEETPEWITFENAELDIDRKNEAGQGQLYWCWDYDGETQHWMYFCSIQDDGTWRCTDFYGHRGSPSKPNVDDFIGRSFKISEKKVNEWLDRLPGLIEKEFSNCDLVLYQAGADSHIDDPLGGRFTTEQYRRRDAIVFQKLSEIGIPVVWNLAGGYQTPVEKVLQLHTITAEEFHFSQITV